MSSPIGPFTYSYCKECGAKESAFTKGVRLNIETEESSFVTVFAGAPTIKFSELVKAVERAKGSTVLNASAQFQVDSSTRSITVMGDISKYEHECRRTLSFDEMFAHAQLEFNRRKTGK